MAEDLKLEIVIQALLDAKGFEEAKTNLEGLTATANKTAPVVQKTGEAAKKMSDSFGGTRGPVADLTRVLLQNVGVTGAAGEAAKAAGTATYFLEGAATATAASVAALTAGVAFLLPLIVDWIRGNKENKEAQADFNQQIDIGLDKLNDLIAKAPGASRVLEDLRKAMRGEQVVSQADALKAMREELVRIDGELRTARDTVERYEQAVSRGFTATYAPAEQARLAIERLTGEKERLLAKARAVEQAMLDGTTVAGEYERIMAGVEKTQDRNAKATDRSAKATERLTEAQKMAIEQDIDARIDIVRSTEKADRDKQKADNAETQRILDYQALQREQVALEEQIALERRMQVADTISLYAQAGAAAAALFGNNKAIAIASAIADTYAGASKALAQGGFFGIAMAAAVIAAGLANVKQIRKANPGSVGFDDPFSDLVATQLGRRSAVDFVEKFGSAFIPGVRRGMGAAMGPGGNTYSSTVNNNYNTNVNALSKRTEFRKFLAVEVAEANRIESRRTIGR